MLAEILSQRASVKIFWAADFYDYTGAAKDCYSSITSITKYSMFKSKNTTAVVLGLLPSIKRYKIVLLVPIIIVI